MLVRDPDLTIHVGDVREVLASLPDGSVDCVVTSPPYWGLRDYGTGTWEGGDEGCDHIAGRGGNLKEWAGNTRGGANKVAEAQAVPMKDVCGRCGARRVDRQLGLEPTPDEYVQNMVAVFREVRRVLADHGTCWVNLGDSYANPSSGGGGAVDVRTDGRKTTPGDKVRGRAKGVNTMAPQFKQKDLCGIPWRVAFALQQPYYAGRIKDERDRAWLAAIMDGEGTICGMRHVRPDGNVRTGCMTFVTNTSEALLNECDRIWPGSRYTEKVTSEVSRPCWRWELQSAADRSALVRELYPYLIEKKRQAMVAWNLLEIVQTAKSLGRGGESAETKAKRDLLVRILSDLNARRPVDLPSWLREPPSLYDPGWYLRSDVIWSKSNPMPESVTDRPTKAHEYVFLLSKGPRYFFDQEAVREPNHHDGRHIDVKTTGDGSHENHKNVAGRARWPNPAGRNVRSVWQIPTQPYPEAHFATFPEDLPRRCILAGSPEFVCTVCDTPVVRGRQQDIAEQETVQAPLRRVRDVLRRPESEVLFSPMLAQAGGTQQAQTAEAVRAVRGDVPGEVCDETVLLAGVLGNVGEGDGRESADDAAGLPPGQLQGREDPRGRLREGLRSRDEEVRPRASAGDGNAPGPSVDIVGVRSPSEWDQDGQPAGESGVDGAEPAQGQRDLPSLRRDVPDSLSPCCGAPMRPGVVLDPFGGSGTTALVARNHGRRSILIELNPTYAKLAADRLSQLSLLTEGAA